MWRFVIDPEHRKGFSLLEVMLATVLLGMALTVFFSAATQGVSFTVKARDYQTYRTWLQELEIREPLDLENLEAGETSGSFQDDDSGTWFWRRTLTPVVEDEEVYHLRTDVWRQNAEPGSGESVETFIDPVGAMQAGWVQEPYDER